MEDVVETYTEEFTGAQVGAQAMDDVGATQQATTIAAGNNAIFAMGGIGTGKFQRRLAMARAKQSVRVEMTHHAHDAALSDARLELQRVSSHSRLTIDMVNIRKVVRWKSYNGCF